MESATVTKTFHGNLTPPKSPALNDRDASFSSYLMPDEPINCQRHLPIGHGGCTALDDSELSIFDAHKYFNEATNNDMQKVTISTNRRVSPLVRLNVEHIPERIDDNNIAVEARRYSSASSSVDGYANLRNYRARSFHASTPTACSEASWNSQTGLLSHPPGAIPVISMRNPAHHHPNDPNRKFRDSLYKPIWLFRRKCPCSGKKSVEVKENSLEHQMPQTPAAPPRVSQSQITRDSLDLKRHQDVDSPNSKMHMETTVVAPNKPETRKIPIITRSNNNNNTWLVDQRPRDQEMFVGKSQRLQSTETQVLPPAIFQSQRVVASVRPFTDGFTFPVLNPNPAVAAIKLQNLNEIDEDQRRESLEIFRPPDIEPSANSVSRKANDTSREHRPNNFPFPPPSPKSRIIDDDVASDASSDLFEIESFSTQTTSTNNNNNNNNYPIINYRRRDSLDEANNFLLGRRSTDSTTPTITECCYEPSEASIDWSVTTAEGAFEINGGEQAPEKTKRKGLLMSCRCEKAVSVGPQPMGQKGATSTTCSIIASSRHVNVNVSSSRVGTVGKAPQGRSRLPLAFGT